MHLLAKIVLYLGLYSVRVHGAPIAQLAYGLAYGLGDPGFDLRYGKEIFLVSKTCKRARGPIQLHFNSGELKRPGGEAVHSPPSTAEIRISGARPLLLVYGVHRDTFAFT